MEILYKNQSYVVAVKDPGVISEAGPNSMPELLAQALSVSVDRIYPVHRLDKATGGVMVYALDPRTAGQLSTAIQQNQFHKRYFVVIEQSPALPSETWKDLLYWDRMKQKSYVVKRNRRGVREAELTYTVIASGSDGRVLCSVDLATGRTHQIRVQFSSRGFPLIGDRRYGSHINGDMGLWAYQLTFHDPKTGKTVTFSSCPPILPPWDDPAFLPIFTQNESCK